MPPRTKDQIYDVKINLNTKKIDHNSGELSLFDTPNYNFGHDWWIIPESDDAVEAKNDLILYQNIIEKINDRSDV
jgi:hypothetical protein